MDLTPTSTKPTTLIALRHGGTHLIQPIIRHLTDQPVYVPKGHNALACVPSPKLVVFLRDPRNRLVSMFRYKRPKAIAEESDEALAEFINKPKKGVLPLGFMLLWARRWVHEKGAHFMRFEELVGPDGLAHTERLREYLGATNPAKDAYEYSLGKSGTFTGRHSRWSEWFGPLATKAWIDQRGGELQSLLGYDK